MTASTFSIVRPKDVAALLEMLVADDGTAGHPYPARTAFRAAPHVVRDLADAVHFIVALHGQRPDLVDLAAMRHPASPIGAFLDRAARAFAVERGLLARLAVVAGPCPSTPGQADCESAVSGQHHALAMLARSDRVGTALGAATALLLDWPAVRACLAPAAERVGLPLPASHLPDAAELLALIQASATTPAVERAVSFGAQQFLLQQRGLWTLLEARAAARRAA